VGALNKDVMAHYPQNLYNFRRRLFSFQGTYGSVLSLIRSSINTPYLLTFLQNVQKTPLALMGAHKKVI